jgi:hypothetical protein
MSRVVVCVRGGSLPSLSQRLRERSSSLHCGRYWAICQSALESLIDSQLDSGTQRGKTEFIRELIRGVVRFHTKKDRII